MFPYTTINREIGAWIRDFREHWMAQTNPGWNGKKRFGCALVGSIISVLTIVLSRIDKSGISVPELLRVDFIYVIVLYLILSVPFIIWFAWIVSWKDFGHGPVRLFLSSIFLVITTFSLIGWIVTLSTI